MTGNSSSRRGLGRGLGALIVNTEENPASAEVLAQADAGGVRLVDVAQIQPNPHQPRSKFDDALLQELADSIGEHGIIQPLIVTAATD
ncbi:MAG: ParB N-terminal domain-containing protein, partial [Caldilineaceae bacterium]|nr:ParB N-terminal domain-containing protein [Caldilineaceae bacterium]